jgi:hypothetical protein
MSIQVDKYYYASTPRLEKQRKMERIKIIEVIGNTVKCITVDPVRYQEIYILELNKIKQ